MNVPESCPVARLTVSFENNVLSVWELPKGASRIIGRGGDVHYQINSAILSRRHCEIKDTGSGIEIKDMGSLNGILVNREKVSQTVLKNGDQVQLGPILITIEITDEVPALPQPQPETPLPEAPLRKGADIAEEDNFIYPSPWDGCLTGGTCRSCGKSVTEGDLASHLAIFKGDSIFCMQCFCAEEIREFPIICGYRIVKKLGKGGMGDVYEAVQLSMERPVAFKLMKGLQNVAEHQLKRFFREARIGGKLMHPNIVGFIDTGKFENGHFITMEFVYGKDVKYIVKQRGRIPYREALRIAYYVAGALDYAQSRYRIVHRDVKPSNVLVDRDRMVKLTDFGLSKNLEDSGLSAITRSNTGVGTIFYMAPEQIVDSSTVDHRVDVYALGVTLYEMLAGARPFTADQLVNLVQRIKTEDPAPVTDLVPEVPASVWPIIAKAMAKKPQDRYQTAGEMQEDLRGVLKTLGHEFR